jgi:hypothetical protein
MFSVFSLPAIAEKSQVFDVEASGGDIYVINGVDLKKKTIKFEGVEMYYNSQTEFVDENGNKISYKSLKKDSRLHFEFDSSKPYITRPTATKITVLPPRN